MFAHGGPVTDQPVPYTLTTIGALVAQHAERHVAGETAAPVVGETVPLHPLYTLGVVADIRRERAAQDARWGEQNHPDGTGSIGWSWQADAARITADDAARAGTLTWRDILLEETLEAFAESDEDKLVAELTQVAAVAVAWIESVRRRQARRFLTGTAADAHDRLVELSHVAGDGGQA